MLPGTAGRDVMRALDGLPVSFAPNTRFQEGQMTSVIARPGGVERTLFCRDDLPGRPGDGSTRGLSGARADIRRAAARRDPDSVPRRQARQPRYVRGEPGAEVLAGTINPGCRKLIEDHPQDVVRREFSHERFTTDMDTPQDYARIRFPDAPGPGESPIAISVLPRSPVAGLMVSNYLHKSMEPTSRAAKMGSMNTSLPIKGRLGVLASAVWLLCSLGASGCRGAFCARRQPGGEGPHGAH